MLTQGRVDVDLGEGPQILIVHTHGSEAYAQTDGDTYEPSDPYRTTDCTHNVVRVGEEMATVLPGPRLWGGPRPHPVRLPLLHRGL